MPTKPLVPFTLAVSLATLLAGCAINGAPAPVVEGKIQRSWQQAPRTASTQPLNRPAAPEATTTLATPIAPIVNEQPLASIQPAAGPTRAPSMPVANRFTTIEVEAAAPPATPAGTPTLHIVQPTDTLFKIARTYNTTPQAIIRANALKNAADVESGRTLTIPANTRATTPSLAERVTTYLRTPPTATAAAQPAPAVPVVETPVAINTPAQFEIARIEPAAGKQAKPAETKPSSLKHTVKGGETIYRISKQYNLSVLDVMAANDLERPEALQAGMVLNIPQQQANLKPAKATTAEQPATKPTLRPAADLGVTEATRATIRPTPTTAEPRPFDPDKGTDSAETIRPLREAAPITEKDKLRAELKRGQIDKDAARARGLIWPARGNITKKFGEKGNGVAHTGINIAVPSNTPVLATESGTVLYADGGLRAYGNMVLVRHSNGMVSAYAHLNHLLVRKGERVQKGQVLAMSGQTGNVESPQLHFELRRNATAIDPLSVLPNS